ncbi:MAG TPA: TolC family protein [Gemmatimonadaceae bacterium]|jgi:outer membrane protein, heavy metal efflux system|nr:TolC family protein [Gemmatimonadaceae bacterium]
MCLDPSIRPFRRRERSSFIVGLVIIIGLAPPAGAQLAGGAQPVLTLRALLDSVRSNHPAVRAADSRVRAAEGSRTTARAFGNPIIGYQVDQTPFPGGGPIPGLEREAMTTATLPLEFLYQRGPRVRRATAEVRAAEAEGNAARQRIGLDAASAYYRAGLAQIQAATTHDLVDWLDTLVAYNRSRVEEGVAAEADLIRSQLERDRVASEASMQDADLAQARAALGAYLSDSRGSAPLPTVAIDDAPLSLPASASPPPSATPALSIDRRPDVRAARERLASSNAAAAGERSMIVRQLGGTIGTMQTAGTTSMIAGVSMALPLFDQNRGEVQRANAERDAAAFELAAQERTATAEIRGAYEAARILTERATLLARRDSTSFLTRAEESRRIALGAYREGAVPLFQVIDAARSWADARITYYKTMAAQHQSILALLVSEGFDLYTTAPTPTSHGDSLR